MIWCEIWQFLSITCIKSIISFTRLSSFSIQANVDKIWLFCFSSCWLFFLERWCFRLELLFLVLVIFLKKAMLLTGKNQISWDPILAFTIPIGSQEWFNHNVMETQLKKFTTLDVFKISHWVRIIIASKVTTTWLNCWGVIYINSYPLSIACTYRR